MFAERKRLVILIGLAVVLAALFVVLHVVPWLGEDDASTTDFDGSAIAGVEGAASNPEDPPDLPAYPSRSLRRDAPLPSHYHRLARAARRPRPENLPALRKAARDPHPKVRAAAVTGIGRLGKDGDPESLMEALAKDPSPAVRAEAAVALGRIKHWDAGPLLIDALADPDSNVRARAGAALRRIMGVDFRYRANDPQRDKVIRRIREWWPKFYEGHLQSQPRKD
jgi:HEAT repeat protein